VVAVVGAGVGCSAGTVVDRATVLGAAVGVLEAAAPLQPASASGATAPTATDRSFIHEMDGWEQGA
jgi:hypothetical protein